MKKEIQTDTQNQRPLEETFSEFHTQVTEMVNHAEQIKAIEFYATLKNGTEFEFFFDSGIWDSTQKKHEGKIRRPASVFNAVVDILGATASVTLLIISIISFSSKVVPGAVAMIILSYVFFSVVFVISSIYHFLPSHHSSRHILARLLLALRVGTLMLTNTSISLFALGYQASTCIFLTILLGAAALFFLTPGTTGGTRFSIICGAILPLLPLLLLPHLVPQTSILPQAGILAVTSILFAVWNLIVFPLPRRATVKAPQVKSNNSFAFIGIFALYFLLLYLVH